MAVEIQENAQANEQTKAEAFAARMLDCINGAALALMTSIGHRTGLFDVLATLPPSSSDEIAEASALNERYVREWLGAMVTGRVVEYDPATGLYELPAEHAAFLTRAAAPNNLAVTTQFVSLLGVVEDEIVRCFREGGGVPYSAYPRFHAVMAEESDQTVGAALFDSILPLAPRALDSLRAGVEVLDVGCGSGRTLIAMAGAFPASRFTGYDLSDEAVARARAEAGRRGLSNIRFEVRDAVHIDEFSRYELVTAFDAIHDQAHPRKVLKAIADALNPGGTFLMQDIRTSSHVHKNLDHPVGTFLYTISCMHCMTVSLACGGEGLGAAWGEEQALRLLSDAGFAEVEVKQLPHDFMNSYFIATKS
jgi:2-polyprenyl-3-methyl-5-hydroxy-6-metoxy-1,4-benzoquinol methylase